MNLHGKIIVIKRNGVDGAHFPLTASCCLFGRSLDSDIRIQLPSVDQSQCQIEIDDGGHVFMRNMSTTAPTLLNNKVLPNQLTRLTHGDLITIVDRQFRFEFPPSSRFFPQKSRSSMTKSPKSPRGKSPGKSPVGARSPRQRSSSKPLSPLTDNVPAPSPKSPKALKSAKKSMSPARQQVTEVATVSHLEFSPSSFYKSSRKSMENVKASVSPAAPSSKSKRPGSPKSPAQRVSTGSPFPKGNANLRKSISDLRRRSVPVFEVEETGSPGTPTVAATAKVATPSSQRKRKSQDFSLPSTKRKRVSFGPSLSPEHFDKNLPPKTPVKKGATPRLDADARKSLLKRKSLSRSSPKKPSPKSSSARKSKSPASRKSTTSPKSVSPVKTPKKSPSPKKPSSGKKAHEGTPANLNASVSISPKGSTPRPTSQKRRSASPSKRASPSKIKRVSTPRNAPSPKSPASPSVKASPRTIDVEIKSKSPSPLKKPATPAQKGGRKSRSPSPTKKAATPLIASVERASRTPSPVKKATPVQKSGRKSRSPSPTKKVATPLIASVERASRTPSPVKKATPVQKSGRKSKSPSSTKKVATPVTASVERASRTPSPVKKPATPVQNSGRKSRSSSPTKKAATPLKASVERASRTNSPATKAASPVLKGGRKSRSPSPKKKVVTPNTGGKLGIVPSILTEEITTLNMTSPVKKATTPGRPGRKSRSPAKGKTATPLSARKNVASRSPSPVKGQQKSRTPSPVKKAVTPVQRNEQKAKTPTGKKAATPVIKGVRESISSPVLATPGRASRSSSPVKNAVSPGQKSGKKSTSTPDLTSVGKIAKTLTPKKVATPRSGRKSISTPDLTVVGGEGSSSSPSKKTSTPTKKSTTPAQKVAGRTVSSPAKAVTPVLQKPATSAKGSTKQRSPSKSATANDRSASRGRKGSVTFGKSPSPTKKATSAHAVPSKTRPYVDTPRPLVSPGKRVHSPKKFYDDSLPSTPSKRATPVNKLQTTPKSGKKSSGKPSAKKLLEKIHLFQSPGEKIIAPPQDIKKVVALRAIHGVTPKLAHLQKTPRSGKKTQVTSVKKVKMWSDIVKQGAGSAKTLPVTARVPKALKAPVAVRKASPKVKKNVGKTPKTPRAMARALAPTTGHADSPATILIGKKISVKSKTKTPKALPRKGRKKSMSKARKSMGNTSFSGIQEMFNTPEVTRKLNESALYADIPDTPNGPNEMIVSPLSGRKSKSPAGRKSVDTKLQSSGSRKAMKASQRKSDPTHLVGVQELFKTPKTKIRKSLVNASYSGLQELFSPAKNARSSQSKQKARGSSAAKSKVSRKSTVLVGVKELLRDVKAQSETNLVGVKELFKHSKAGKASSPSGIKNLMKTPKVKSASSVTPTGVKRIMATPKRKNTPASPSGLDQLFKSPKNLTPVPPKPSSAAKSSRKTKAAPKQIESVSPVPVKSPLKRGGRKRRGNDAQPEASPKKIKVSEPSPSPVKPRATRRGAVAAKKSPVKKAASKTPKKVHSPEKTLSSPVESPIKPPARGRNAPTKKSPVKKAIVVEKSPSPIKPRATRRGAVSAPKKSPAKKAAKTVVASPKAVLEKQEKPAAASPVKRKATRGKAAQPSPKQEKPAPVSPVKRKATRVKAAQPSPKQQEKPAPVSPVKRKATRGKAAQPSPASSPAKPRTSRQGKAAAAKKSPKKVLPEEPTPKPIETTVSSPIKGKRTQGTKKLSPVKVASPLVKSPVKRGRKGAPSAQSSKSPDLASPRKGRSKGRQRVASPAKVVEPVLSPPKSRKRKADLEVSSLISPPKKKTQQVQGTKTSKPEAKSPKPAVRKGRHAKSPSPKKAASLQKKATRAKVQMPVEPSVSQISDNTKQVAETGRKGGRKTVTTKESATPVGKAASPVKQRATRGKKASPIKKAISPKPAKKGASPKPKTPRGGSKRKNVEIAAITKEDVAAPATPPVRRGQKAPLKSQVSPKPSPPKSRRGAKKVTPKKGSTAKAVNFASPAKAAKKGTKSPAAKATKSPVVARRSTRRR